MGPFRQEHWSELPCSPPGDLPDPGIKLASLTSPTLAGVLFTTSATWEASGPHTSYLSRPQPHQPSSWTAESHDHLLVVTSKQPMTWPDKESFHLEPVSCLKSSLYVDFPPVSPWLKGGEIDILMNAQSQKSEILCTIKNLSSLSFQIYSYSLLGPVKLFYYSSIIEYPLPRWYCPAFGQSPACPCKCDLLSWHKHLKGTESSV